VLCGDPSRDGVLFSESIRLERFVNGVLRYAATKSMSRATRLVGWPRVLDIVELGRVGTGVDPRVDCASRCAQSRCAHRCAESARTCHGPPGAAHDGDGVDESTSTMTRTARGCSAKRSESERASTFEDCPSTTARANGSARRVGCRLLGGELPVGRTRHPSLRRRLHNKNRADRGRGRIPTRCVVPVPSRNSLIGISGRTRE
jgi:hypothetical protein